MPRDLSLLEALYGHPLCVVVLKQHGALHCEQQIFGPFADYMDAEEALTDGRVPLLYGQGGRAWPENADQSRTNGHRFIVSLLPPVEL
jgi:hypothetical protein